MKRRTTLKLGLAAAAAGTAAGTLSPAPSFAGSHGSTALVLAHGSWHGAWCWGLVNSTCAAIVADMNAAWPASPTPLIDLETSHEAMFSSPEALADLLIGAT